MALPFLTLRQERSDAAELHAAIADLRSLGVDEQILLAIPLRDEVLRRNVELVGEHAGNRFRPAVREREIILVRADRIGVTLDEEHFIGTVAQNPLNRLGDDRQAVDLVVADLPRSELEIDRVQIDARHPLPKTGARADFIQRVFGIDILNRRRAQCILDVLLRCPIGVDVIALARDADYRRGQLDIEAEAGAATTFAAMMAPPVIGVVDQHEFAPVGPAPYTPDQPAVIIDDRHDANIAARHGGDPLAVIATFFVEVAALAEACRLVMPDERAALTADDAAVVRLFNDDPATFLAPLAPRLHDILQLLARELASFLTPPANIVGRKGRPEGVEPARRIRVGRTDTSAIAVVAVSIAATLLIVILALLLALSAGLLADGGLAVSVAATLLIVILALLLALPAGLLADGGLAVSVAATLLIIVLALLLALPAGLLADGGLAVSVAATLLIIVLALLLALPAGLLADGGLAVSVAATLLIIVLALLLARSAGLLADGGLAVSVAATLLIVILALLLALPAGLLADGGRLLAVSVAATLLVVILSLLLALSAGLLAEDRAAALELAAALLKPILSLLQCRRAGLLANSRIAAILVAAAILILVPPLLLLIRAATPATLVVLALTLLHLSTAGLALFAARAAFLAALALFLIFVVIVLALVLGRWTSEALRVSGAPWHGERIGGAENKNSFFDADRGHFLNLTVSLRLEGVTQRRGLRLFRGSLRCIAAIFTRNAAICVVVDEQPINDVFRNKFLIWPLAQVETADRRKFVTASSLHGRFWQHRGNRTKGRPVEMDGKVFTFLMFEGKAEEAMNFYVSLFPDAAVTGITRYGAGQGGAEGSVMHAQFTLAGQAFMCIDSPAKHDFTFTPAMSIYVQCETEAEVDALFARLAEGGQVLMPLDTYPFSPKFGWLADRFGVSWQLNLRKSGPEARAV